MSPAAATPAVSLRLTTGDLRLLLAHHQPPCISLYEPTHRSYPASNDEDPVRYRNLLRQAEISLRRKYSWRVFRPVLKKLEGFIEDTDFWIHGTEGLAVFGSPDELKVFKLPQAVPEVASVAEHFHIKPLVRVLQRDERYQILALTLSEAKLYEGTPDTLDPVDLTGIPTKLTEALGTEVTEPFLKVTRSYGSGPSGKIPMYHGQGDHKDERNRDRERFFRIIDREILEHFSNRTRLPLVLAALPEHQAHFREISRNPFLISPGVERHPDALAQEELREAAWKTLEPFFEQRVAKLMSDYGEARAHGRGSDNAEEVAEALAQGRVGTLLIEENKRIAGRVDVVRGRVSYAGPEEPDIDPALEDVLDDLAEGVLRTLGEVLVVPASKMPSRTGLAAIYRF